MQHESKQNNYSENVNHNNQERLQTLYKRLNSINLKSEEGMKQVKVDRLDITLADLEQLATN